MRIHIVLTTMLTAMLTKRLSSIATDGWMPAVVKIHMNPTSLSISIADVISIRKTLAFSENRINRLREYLTICISAAEMTHGVSQVPHRGRSIKNNR